MSLPATKLNADDLDQWFDKQYLDYASETRDGKRLRFKIHARSNTAKVTHGDRVVYEGDMATAIEKYNKA